MRLCMLHGKLDVLDKLIAFKEDIPKEAQSLYKTLKICDQLLFNKTDWTLISEALKISRSKYYRLKKAAIELGWKGLIKASRRPKHFRTSNVPQDIIDKIIKIRQNNPCYGRAKILHILKRDYAINNISESTVGRILRRFVNLGTIKSSFSYRKSKRSFKRVHAKPWNIKLKSDSPGELAEIDHMVVRKNGISFKYFSSYDPNTKFVVSDITSTATKKFLNDVVNTLPFNVKSAEVDGGSEFMKEFELECKKLEIDLFPKFITWFF